MKYMSTLADTKDELNYEYLKRKTKIGNYKSVGAVL